MHTVTKLMMSVAVLWLCATPAAADPIVLTAGEVSNTRTDTSVTIPGPGPLIVSLANPVPTWFGILNPGELVNLTAEISVPFRAGTLELEGVTFEASATAPILFEYALRTPTFPLVFGTGTPFAIQGAFSGAFGRAEIAGGGTISITDAALTFTFQPDPPAVPAPIPEPGTLLVVASGLAFI